MRVEAFRGLRPPSSEVAARVLSPPYDTVTEREAREITRANPQSFLRVVLPHTDFADAEEEVKKTDAVVYARGRENLHAFMEEGLLERDAEPSMYVYRVVQGPHVQTGVCCNVSVEDYEGGGVRRHERTRKDKEDDRTRLTDVQNANCGPVFLCHRHDDSIDSLVHEVTASAPPDLSATASDGVQHILWCVTEPDRLDSLRAAFSAMPCSYIADGHHRSASAARVCRMRLEAAEAAGETVAEDDPLRFFMAVLFPAEQLQVLEYNRMVTDLNGLTEDEFLARVREHFEVARINADCEAAAWAGTGTGVEDGRDGQGTAVCRVPSDTSLHTAALTEGTGTDLSEGFEGGTEGSDDVPAAPSSSADSVRAAGGEGSHDGESNNTVPLSKDSLERHPETGLRADLFRARAVHEINMFLGGHWYRLLVRKSELEQVAGDPVRSLDVQLLYDHLLHPVLGIGNPREDTRIAYVGGIHGSQRIQDSCSGDADSPHFAVGFVMHPVTVDQVMAIADAQELMPPKATWFEPKLASGLVVRTYDDGCAEAEEAKKAM